MKLKKFSFAVMALFMLVFVAPAAAWHVTIHNPHGIEATVQCWKANWNVYSVEAVIPPNASHTFKTGAQCPLGLTGSIVGFDGVRKEIKLTCLGPRREHTSYIVNCAHNCFHSEWTVEQHADGTWHFHKGYNHDDYYPEADNDNEDDDEE
ncbi:MAG: hypothetical protein ABFD62_08145 [Syntrophaceae bacterium]